MKRWIAKHKSASALLAVVLFAAAIFLTLIFKNGFSSDTKNQIHGEDYEAARVSIFYRFAHFLSEFGKKNAEKENPVSEAPIPSPKAEENIPPEEISFGNISEAEYAAPKDGRALRINLETMSLARYENGRKLDSFTVASKGKCSRAPAGNFKILHKEEEHRSSDGKIIFPDSMEFFGNYFMHAPPEDPNGNPLAGKTAFGCLAFSLKDMKALYEWTGVGTAVSIFNNNPNSPEELGGTSYFREGNAGIPNVSAKAYAVGDVSSGEIFLKKNVASQMPIASVTKLMTALVSLEFLNQSESTNVSKDALATYGDNGGFRIGERIRNSDILFPLLLESSNDAGEILAEEISRSFFIGAMNEKARELGLARTSYDDPTGLSAKNVSTADDLFALARYIRSFKNDIFDITRNKNYSANGHFWQSNNQFLKEAGYGGGKSGYTDPARETVVALFEIPVSEFGSRTIAVTLLGSEDRRRDTLALVDFVRKNVFLGSAGGKIAAVPMPPPPPQTDTTIVFGGDIMLDRGVRSSVAKNFAGDYSALFKNLEILKSADIAFANLEGDVSDKGNNVGSRFSFRMDPIVLPAIKGAGIDIVSFANNHVGDWNVAAFDDTRARLAQNGISYVGAGDDKSSAATPVVIEHNGTRFGFIGFSDVGPDWLSAKEKSSGILLASDPDFDAIIRKAAAGVDVLVVSFHWGVEYQEHTARQTALAHRAIDDGARLVIGHHPHVEQATETYKNGLIAYSLGNLIFDQYFSPETMQGMLLSTYFDGKELKEYRKRIVKLNSFFQPETVTEEK